MFEVQYRYNIVQVDTRRIKVTITKEFKKIHNWAKKIGISNFLDLSRNIQCQLMWTKFLGFG